LNQKAFELDAAPSGAASEILADISREDFYSRLIEGMRCGVLVIERTAAS
jgi:hypothetical protein